VKAISENSPQCDKTLPEGSLRILEYLKRYPTFSFSSGRLSKVFGISSQKISKILYELYQRGYLEKRTRGNIKRQRAFYKYGKDDLIIRVSLEISGNLISNESRYKNTKRNTKQPSDESPDEDPVDIKAVNEN
jgi:hypothetical protein